MTKGKHLVSRFAALVDRLESTARRYDAHGGGQAFLLASPWPLDSPPEGERHYDRARRDQNERYRDEMTFFQTRLVYSALLAEAILRFIVAVLQQMEELEAALSAFVHDIRGSYEIFLKRPEKFSKKDWTSWRRVLEQERYQRDAALCRFAYVHKSAFNALNVALREAMKDWARGLPGKICSKSRVNFYEYARRVNHELDCVWEDSKYGGPASTLEGDQRQPGKRGND
ncbi:MAG: hypothetical protein LBS31_00715 [Candidatus Adiutrix sp.]|jgi:hypothetical protein|nr:hypothetical protein [Candidatus Adiutrix sp.]